ncbi:hypothetical protein ERHA54_26300 [Erwinia rhapontici]|uniref:Protein-S-isoprenylcysteine O-methyltransferase Ste14 n=1 Tax=Erwinia rhapontici TaxID=55212 RepID=A0ABM7N0Y0_ERWRD|nr:DUF1295 domain-containing protein [Erwinia rhapontici]BCQ35124.1 hypothetical protein ERHA53_24670 [Erwinia rhapontici]BCQ40027.1 hypothetical protein ERHA54_26300 [Erwinia rhapontici]
MNTLFFINLHKALVIPVIIFLMWFYQNDSMTAYIYLALHGTYSVLWLVKEATFPDQRFARQIPPAWAGWLFIFVPLAAYYATPYLLISRHVIAPPWLVCLVLALYITGIYLHYVSDAQKFYTLKVKKGLITEGLFAYSRNPNYLGEIIIYLSFSLLAMHGLPFIVLAGWCIFFIRNMRLKDRSLSRYPEFEQYRQRSRLL